MPTTHTVQSETERMARVITRCYSRATLAIAAHELGVEAMLDHDIFRALIVAKIATDFDDAVRIVARHSDGGSHDALDDEDLVDGKIERRKVTRK